MKNWKNFLLWFVCFFLIGIFLEMIKSLSETGVLNMYAFALIALIILIIGWTCVFFITKSVKNNNKKRNQLLTGFVCFMIVLSVSTTFDVMKYSLDYNLLNKYYFMGIGSVFMVIGWIAGRSDYVLPKNKKQK